MTRRLAVMVAGGLAVAGLAVAFGGLMALRGGADRPVVLGASDGADDPAGGVAGAVAAMLVPHKAIYAMTMTERRSGADILNISGHMYYELKKTCDAWVSDHRFNMVYEYAETPPMRITSDFVTYEPLDGGSLDFTSRRRRDGSVFQELRGRAEADAKTIGAAVFSMPEGLRFDLAQGTLFPMAHTVATLQAAQAGQTFFYAPMFDGSDEDGPVEVNVFIGKKINAMDERGFAAAVDPVLVNTPAWRMHLAFFPGQSKDPQPDYEMDIVLHENGMISHMDVDYEDFSVAQTLQALETLPVPECNGSAAAK